MRFSMIVKANRSARRATGSDDGECIFSLFAGDEEASGGFRARDVDDLAGEGGEGVGGVGGAGWGGEGVGEGCHG